MPSVALPAPAGRGGARPARRPSRPRRRLRRGRRSDGRAPPADRRSDAASARRGGRVGPPQAGRGDGESVGAQLATPVIGQPRIDRRGHGASGWLGAVRRTGHRPAQAPGAAASPVTGLRKSRRVTAPSPSHSSICSRRSVFGRAFASYRRAGLDLAAVESHGQIGDDRVFGLARALAHAHAPAAAQRDVGRRESLGQRTDRLTFTAGRCPRRGDGGAHPLRVRDEGRRPRSERPAALVMAVNPSQSFSSKGSSMEATSNSAKSSL